MRCELKKLTSSTTKLTLSRLECRRFIFRTILSYIIRSFQKIHALRFPFRRRNSLLKDECHVSQHLIFLRVPMHEWTFCCTFMENVFTCSFIEKTFSWHKNYRLMSLFVSNCVLNCESLAAHCLVLPMEGFEKDERQESNFLTFFFRYLFISKDSPKLENTFHSEATVRMFFWP